MNWSELVKFYPDEWVASINYKHKDETEIEGKVVAHDSDWKLFCGTVGQLLPKFHDMAIRYTGELEIDEEVP